MREEKKVKEASYYKVVECGNMAGGRPSRSQIKLVLAFSL